MSLCISARPTLLPHHSPRASHFPLSRQSWTPLRAYRSHTTAVTPPLCVPRGRRSVSSRTPPLPLHFPTGSDRHIPLSLSPLDTSNPMLLPHCRSSRPRPSSPSPPPPFHEPVLLVAAAGKLLHPSRLEPPWSSSPPSSENHLVYF
jgi:hypothetical protein